MSKRKRTTITPGRGKRKIYTGSGELIRKKPEVKHKGRVTVPKDEE